MTELKFNTEGKTDCPMKGKATPWDCSACIYYKWDDDNRRSICIYKDIFTEEGMGLNA